MRELIILLLLTGICFASWTTPVNITDFSPNYAYIPSLSIDSGNNLHVFFKVVDPEMSVFNSVYYTSSSDGGLVWSSPLMLFNSTIGGMGISGVYTDVNSSDSIFVTFIDETHLYMNKSDDGGETWHGSLILDSPYVFQYPYFVFDSYGGMHLVLVESGGYGPNRVFYLKSNDSGSSWSAPFNMSRDLSAQGDSPSICVHGDKVYAAWGRTQEPGGTSSVISFSKSIDRGATWSDIYNITSLLNGFARCPELQCDSEGNIHLAFNSHFSTMEMDVFYSKSVDDGATWSVPLNLSNSTADDGMPLLEVSDSGEVNIIFVIEPSLDDNNMTHFYSEDGLVWSSYLIENNGYNNYIDSDLFDLNSEGVPYAVFETWTSPDYLQANPQFTFLFNPPILPGFSLKDASGNAFDFNSTSLKINGSAVNVTWFGLNSSVVYPLGGMNLSSSIAISSDADSASITVSEESLNLSANVTVTGLTGVTNPIITHNGVVVYENGALTAENGADDLLSDPVFADGTLTMEVGSFSEWTVEEASVSADNLTISAPESDFPSIIVLFLLSLAFFLKIIK